MSALIAYLGATIGDSMEDFVSESRGMTVGAVFDEPVGGDLKLAWLDGTLCVYEWDDTSIDPSDDGWMLLDTLAEFPRTYPTLVHNLPSMR